MQLFRHLVASCLVLFSFLFSFCTKANEAEALFSNFSPALVQIKCINIESGQKSSIGTGFFISESGHIVTNYHVISNFIQSPEQYRLELLDNNEQTHIVDVVDIDVINDLAILDAKQPWPVHFPLASEPPTKGQEIYSLGNPHDLGMIVVPGTYNGIKSKSFYKRIHFTGSINSGMSGGPTVDESGNVVGINVASAGNQIGFLVPVDRLVKLKQQALTTLEIKKEEAFFVDRITKQLTDNQSELYQNLIQTEWPMYNLGQAKVPNELSDFMPCWGDSNQDKEKELYTAASTNCALSERIYLSSNMTTGHAQMGFSWIHSDKLNQLQLATLFTQTLNRQYSRNNAGQDDVTDFYCQEALINNTQQTTSKGISCVRAYRKYAGLYDVRFHSLLLEKNDQTLVGRYVLQGVSEATAQSFFTKFVESISWN